MTSYESPTVAAYYGVTPGSVLLTSGVAGFTASATGNNWANSFTGAQAYASNPSVTGGSSFSPVVTDPSVVSPSIHTIAAPSVSAAQSNSGTVSASTSSATPAASSQLIPGLNNKILLLGGAALLAVFLMRRR